MRVDKCRCSHIFPSARMRTMDKSFYKWNIAIMRAFEIIIGNLQFGAYLKYGDINTLRLTPMGAIMQFSDDWGSD